MKIDKTALLERIKAALEAELRTVQSSAAEARAEATHEDAKPENQYDTRGLEASYLAGAQAGRAADLAHRINNLDFVPVRGFDEDTPIGVTAIIELDDGEATRTYFLAPDGGGMKLDTEAGKILVITPQSPIGRGLLEKKTGDIVEIRLAGKVVEVEIVSVA